MSKRKRALKKVPTFKSEDAEREFWATADSTEYLDWSKARMVRFPNLRPSVEPDRLDRIDAGSPAGGEIAGAEGDRG